MLIVVPPTLSALSTVVAHRIDVASILRSLVEDLWRWADDGETFRYGFTRRAGIAFGVTEIRERSILAWICQERCHPPCAILSHGELPRCCQPWRLEKISTDLCKKHLHFEERLRIL